MTQAGACRKAIQERLERKTSVGNCNACAKSRLTAYDPIADVSFR
jgi:hypothetical protein